MQILTAAQIREADAYTIANEPIASIDLMERASQRFCRWFAEKFDTDKQVHIFCGTGNNGGDGLAVARILKGRGYQVRAYVIAFSSTYSNDCQENLHRLKQFAGFNLSIHTDKVSLDNVNQQDIVIDALFGSGLSRPVEGFAAELIEALNTLNALRVAVDIPSGLYADKLPDGPAFKAHYTVTFQRPKLSFMLPECAHLVGEWVALPIGLHPAFLQKQQSSYLYTTTADITVLPRAKFAHKGSFGHALVMGGSFGKMGAAMLSAKAALQSGTGLVSAYVPRCGYGMMQAAFPEAMVIIDPHEEVVTHLPVMEKFDAVGIGPGLGTNALTANALKQLLQQASKPLVIDADALNILAENKHWLALLPENTLLTPHPKEFARMFGETADSLQRLQLLRQKATGLRVVIVLKGAHTAIALPNGDIWFNTTGNQGMATGGSGDVLTGILTGLLAQGYAPADAALLGVYLHGLAGDLAACNHSPQAMLASHITEHIGAAYVKLINGKAWLSLGQANKLDTFI